MQNSESFRLHAKGQTFHCAGRSSEADSMDSTNAQGWWKISFSVFTWKIFNQNYLPTTQTFKPLGRSHPSLPRRHSSKPHGRLKQYWWRLSPWCSTNHLGRWPYRQPPWPLLKPLSRSWWYPKSRRPFPWRSPQPLGRSRNSLPPWRSLEPSNLQVLPLKEASLCPTNLLVRIVPTVCTSNCYVPERRRKLHHYSRDSGPPSLQSECLMLHLVWIWNIPVGQILFKNLISNYLLFIKTVPIVQCFSIGNSMLLLHVVGSTNVHLGLYQRFRAFSNQACKCTVSYHAQNF